MEIMEGPPNENKLRRKARESVSLSLVIGRDSETGRGVGEVQC